MRYTQLRAFHHVALHEGFSRAAEALNQTQPSVSDQVRRLEQAHDTLLFLRERRQVRLTAAGEDLFRLTREFFDVEERIGDFLEHSRSAITGKLRIVADSALHITAAVGRFRAAHPKVFVSIHTGNTAEVLQRLRDYEAEIGVVGNIDPAPDLDLVDLGRSPIVALVRKGYLPEGKAALGFNDLQSHPLIFREQGSRTRANLEDEARRRKLPLAPAIEVEGREAMREVVASGAGIGFVSEAEFGHDDRLVSVPIEGMSLAMSEALVSLKARRDVPVIRAFQKSIAGVAQPF
ncbi:MAG: LysR family transcriptional regulator [Silicimonas sp.]|nr:LysR family transcriptional regulator [Silicimonas sp.]